MRYNFSLFEVLIIIGVTHGFLIAALIWLNRKRSVSKLILSLVLAVFNLLCIRILILTTGAWQTQLFRYFPLPFELAIPPLIWLYALSLTTPGFRPRPSSLVHFIPFAISLIYSIFIYFSVIGTKDLIAKDAIADNFYFNYIKEIEDFLLIISSIVYWWLGLRIVLKYRHWLYNNISDTDYPTYAWLKNVSILMGILIAGLVIDILLDYFFHFGINHFLHWQVFFIYLAVLIYYLGFRGFQLPGKQILIPENKTTLLPAIAGEQSLKINREIKLQAEKERQVEQAIKEAFEIRQLYLDPELNLQKLANEINTTPAIASSVINRSFKKSFRNLVNEYRVDKVKQRLNDPGSARLSILGIAYECGFNSEASFYRIFKDIAGVSPKEYLKRLQSPD
ncbi:MAG: AraC family transcriptional regulator [Bacteroidota bacterium]